MFAVRSLCAATAPALRSQARVSTGLAVRCMSTEASFDLKEALIWGDIEAPAATTTSDRDELLDYFRQMYTIRRMEIASDIEYKAKHIRGFCHLYDGQEAVAMGIEAGLTREDSIITSYRCHGIDLVRGDSVEAIMAEMFGHISGTAKGKGGSMHLYHKDTNFWGGCGIVGAQVPVGAGLALANKYLHKEQWPVPISIGMFGDGAVNQGQVWEAANIAKLWKLPFVLVIENNRYGMGTSAERSSCNTEYYKQGGVAIPGIRADGMDVLSAREAMRAAKAHAAEGNGPVYLEYMTYRYHGHSMSDPGLSYRDRDEVKQVRQTSDPIELLRGRILDAELATSDELKAIEKEVKAHVKKSVAAAKASTLPPESELYTDVEIDGPAYIRGVEVNSGIGL